MLVIHPDYDRLHFVGDSLTAAFWYTGLVTLINASNEGVRQRSARVVGRQSRTVGIVGKSRAVISPRSISVTTSGVSGDRIANIAADVPGRITSFAPTVIVIDCAINDSTDIFNTLTTEAAVMVTWGTFLTAVAAANPNARIAITSTFCRGENWGVGPLWNNSGTNQTDLVQDSLNAALAALAAARGYEFIDFRAALLAGEAINNTPSPGVHFGIYALNDGGLALHPNAAGAVLMCATAFTHFQVAA